MLGTLTWYFLHRNAQARDKNNVLSSNTEIWQKNPTGKQSCGRTAQAVGTITCGSSNRTGLNITDSQKVSRDENEISLTCNNSNCIKKDWGPVVLLKYVLFGQQAGERLGKRSDTNTCWKKQSACFVSVGFIKVTQDTRKSAQHHWVSTV